MSGTSGGIDIEGAGADRLPSKPVVYVFRGYPRESSAVTVGPKGFVLSVFGTGDELDEMFGGSLTFRNFDTDERWVGVWGTSNTSRFRRLLRAVGGTYDVVREPPPEPARLAFASTGIRPTPAQRGRLDELLMLRTRALGEACPLRRHVNLDEKRALQAGRYSRVIVTAGRTSDRQGSDPNDRQISHEVERRMKRMSPEELDQLLRDGKDS